MRLLVILAASVLASCAANQEAMLRQDALQSFTSTKRPGEVAACAAQRLNSNPAFGTDGINYWVTRSSNAGVAVRYDFRPGPSGVGTVVEYRSRLRINNGLAKVQSCL